MFIILINYFSQYYIIIGVYYEFNNNYDVIFKLGPNGYVMSINSNGYVVFHPNLMATVRSIYNISFYMYITLYRIFIA